MKYVKSLADEQLIAEFEKIRMAVADIKSNELRRTLKRASEALEPDTSKKQKSTEAPIPSVPDVPQPQVVSSSKSSGTRRKSLGRSRITKPKLDLDADDKKFIKVVSDGDSEDEAPILWSAFAGWEVISTPLGEINVMYMMNRLTKIYHSGRSFSLWWIDRIYEAILDWVVKHYETIMLLVLDDVRVIFSVVWDFMKVVRVLLLETINSNCRLAVGVLYSYQCSCLEQLFLERVCTCL
ncbi:hypothetical protein Tco_0797110 [Tanacetum coccineum]